MARPLKACLETIALLELVLDATGRVVHWNAACEAASGFGAREVVGRRLWEVVVPRDEATALRLTFDALCGRGDDVTCAEESWRRRDGTRRWIGWRRRAVRDDDGRLLGVVARGFELPAEREGHGAQHRSEALMRAAFESAADGLVTVDARQRIVLFNNGAERLLGYRATEVLGQPLDVLLPADARLRHRGHVRAFVGTGQARRRMAANSGAGIVARRSDGTEVPVDVALSRCEVDGEPFLTAALRDAADQRRRESEQRFLAEAGAVLATALEDEQVALDAVSDLVVASDLADACVVDLLEADGVRLRRTALAHRDVARAAELGKFVGQSIPRTAASLCARAVALGRPCLIEHLEPDESLALAESSGPCALLHALRPHSVLIVPLVAGDREILGAIAFANTESAHAFGERDLQLGAELAWRVAMTIQNARLHRQARQALRARDRVLGLVAHDLRSPLGTILICTQLLEHELPDGAGTHRAEVEHTLALTRRTVQRMDRLIHDLLDVAALEAGHLVLDREPVSPARLLDEAVTSLRPRAEALSVELVVAERLHHPLVLADCDRVVRVLCNLVDNAIKFTPTGGRVTVSTQTGDAEVCFSVQDSGSGIAPDDCEHLFEPFWKADPDDPRGVGLGLPICKEIIEVHGGRIGVSSPPGEGATFWFTLPLSLETSQRPSSSPGVSRVDPSTEHTA